MSDLMWLELTPAHAEKVNTDQLVAGGKLAPNKLGVEDGVVEIKARSSFMATAFIGGGLLILFMIGMVILSIINGSIKDTGIGLGIVALIFSGCGAAAIYAAVQETNARFDAHSKTITLSRLWGRKVETIGADRIDDVVVILSASPKGCMSWLRLEKGKDDVININTKGLFDDKRAVCLLQLACWVSARFFAPLRVEIIAVDGLDIMSRPQVAEFLKSLPKPKVTRPLG